MNLSPREKDKLLISMAAMVARRRLERGVKLNHPEAIAIISDFIVEGARDGRTVAELMQSGAQVITRAQCMDGIAEMIHAEPALARPLASDSQVRHAELVYSVRYEHALTLGDLLIRRAGAAFRARDHGMSLAAPAAEVVAPLLGWTEELRDAAVAEYARDVARMFTVDPD